MSEKKQDMIVRRWPEYLKLHRGNPRGYPLEVERFAGHIETSKVTIYSWAKKDARVMEIVKVIRNGEPASAFTEETEAQSIPTPDLLDAAALSRELRDLLGLANNACRHFAAEYQRHAVEDAPLTAWQLEVTTNKLLALVREIRPKREAILRRERGDAQPSLL